LLINVLFDWLVLRLFSEFKLGVAKVILKILDVWEKEGLDHFLRRTLGPAVADVQIDL